MFKKLMQKLSVSALVAILPVVLMGGVVAHGADPITVDYDDVPEANTPPDNPAEVPRADGLPSQSNTELDRLYENSANETNAMESDPRVGEAQKAFDQAAKDRGAAEQNYDNAVSEVEKAKAALDAEKASDDGIGNVSIDDREKDLQQAKQNLEAKNQALLNAESAERQASQNLKSAEQRAIDEFNNQKQSVLPSTTRTIAECKVIMNKVQMDSRAAKEKFEKRDDVYVKEVLGCGIKTGDISLWMVPYYIRFILEFILQLGGLIAVGGIIYGGYLYLFAGLSDDKDRGKKAILYGVGGIVLAMTAWALVNIVISVVTA